MKKSMMLALMSGALFSCGGADFSVWKVSSDIHETTCTSDQPNQGDPPDDTDNRLRGGTWEIYEGTDDKYYLSTDSGLGGTYEGKLNDKTYTFGSVVKEHAPWAAGSREVTTTTTSTISLTIDGNFFTGTKTEEVVVHCAGTDCANDNNYTCTTKSDLFGTKVDPELRHTP